VEVVGVTRVRNCCTFLWSQDARYPRRVVFFRAHHCAPCAEEMIRSAKLQRIAVAGSVRMDRVREALAQQRADLLDRWERQLLATAEAGFALDPATREVLPHLLDAADRALERRFRTVPPGTPQPAAQAQRAAMQASLLGDFLFDAALEKLPELSTAEQRLMGAALAHAAVEVLVEGAVDREWQRRKRESARLARLAHDLRNSATAARLALDLLRRRGDLADSRASRLLEASLAQLRDGIEDTLLDEALHAGAPRLGEVHLAPLIDGAAAELEAREKNVKIVLASAIEGLRVRADPRLVRPAVRGLLRAAMQVARAGATIRVGAGRSRGKAHVAVSVSGCRRLPDGRLATPGVLSLARRAARAQGGSLSARLLGAGGWELRFSLPRVQND